MQMLQQKHCFILAEYPKIETRLYGMQQDRYIETCKYTNNTNNVLHVQYKY